jgi:hypothetical protein
VQRPFAIAPPRPREDGRTARRDPQTQEDAIMQSEYDSIPQVDTEAQISDQIVKRIRKLSWMGRDEETVRLAQFLAQMPHSSTVLGAPLETD